MKKFFYFLLVTLFFILNIENSFSYEDKEVHPEITVYSIDSSEIVNYFKTTLSLNLNVNDGLSWEKRSKQIKNDPFLKRIKEGSTDEDVGTRSREHFYNPINGKAFLGQFKTSLQRACNLSEEANELFYDYLTYSDLANREEKLRDCLYKLGRMVHLLEDASVPAHVRDDHHYHKSYTDWMYNDGDLYERYTFKELMQLSYSGYDPVAISDFTFFSKFWDWNKGGAGEAAEGIFDDNSKGIAEYTFK